MIHGHAALDLRWDGTGHVASGEREHTLGLSVAGADGEKGVVASWRFDGESLVVEGHPDGYLPLFVWQGTNRIMVGTSPLALVAAGADASIDREGVGLALRIGFYLGERSPFAHIRLAPRGKRLTWSRGVARIEGPGMRVVPATVRSVEEGVAGYCELFRAAMRRRPPAPGSEGAFAMPLSGGRDSRMMLLESIANGHRPAACVTLSGGEESEHPDAVIARQLCRRVGTPLVEVESRTPWVEAERRKHVLGSLLVLEHTWMMPLWDTLRSSFGCWYDGLGAGAITRGDLCRPEFLEHYRRGDWSAFLRDFAGCAISVDESTVAQLARLAGWIEPSEDAAIALLREELAHFEGAANPLTAFSFANWGGRAISLNPYMLCAPIRDIHTPFMDADLVRFLLGYPVELALTNDLQTDAARRLYPDVADIPFDKDLPKWKRRRRPLVQAIAGRMSTMRGLRAMSSTFRGLGTAAALKGDARLTSMLTMLGLLEQASSQGGSRRLLEEFGFGSTRDRESLEVHRVRRAVA